MSFLSRLQRFLTPHPAALATLSAPVTDSPGWGALTERPHDPDPATMQEAYSDALTAWRRNPLAWRIIAITADYVLGDGIRISSPQRSLRNFIHAFWHHPLNRMDNRLESMCDELARSGDLFVLLFRNPQDGMSYIRFVTKDRIQKIETAPNDWEIETAFLETQDTGIPLRWRGAASDGRNPENADVPQGSEDAVMLHYTVNRPLGALLGESDLAAMLPWLMRYARMLEDRLRLHWAVRSFLWMVTVPTHKIKEKQQQYAHPPEAGAIVVKDEGENWQAVTPNLNATDAQHDLKAVRGMIDAGSGYPPHWRGEAADANLATATAMQTPAERHLKRRQQYFIFVLQDILYHAYQRAATAGFLPRLKTSDYDALFTVQAADISRDDNEAMARAAAQIAQTYQVLGNQFNAPRQSPRLARLFTRLIFKFAGAPLDEGALDDILSDVQKSVPPE
jgi:hypothetical protein